MPTLATLAGRNAAVSRGLFAAAGHTPRKANTGAGFQPPQVLNKARQITARRARS